MTNTNQLEDFKINVKFKLSALWTTVMFCYIYGDYFSLYVPGQIEALMNGKTLLVSPLKLLAASILMTIPPLMIFLSLTLKPNVNRLSNVIFGTIYSIIMMLIALDSIEPWWTFMVFLAIVEIFTTSLIVWFAWKWPKQDRSFQ
jgi:hypothetical protein